MVFEAPFQPRANDEVVMPPEYSLALISPINALKVVLE
jgi:hypothetical protein